MTHLILTAALRVGAGMIPLLQVRKARLREVSQGHTRSQLEAVELGPSCLLANRPQWGLLRCFCTFLAEPCPPLLVAARRILNLPCGMREL